MANRGGRGGKTTSFTQEQLNALGVGKDVPVVLAPPPLFPPLLNKPVPLEANADREYKILWKEDFLTYLRDSPYFLDRQNKNDGGNSQRYSDTLVVRSHTIFIIIIWEHVWLNPNFYLFKNELENEEKGQSKSDFNYSFMPAELRPNFKRPRTPGTALKAKKSKPNENLESKLKVLEEKEKMDGGEDGEGKDKKKKSAGGTGGGDDDDDDENDENDEVIDEEMDDENDYGNNYFDNGESFNEEDDNLDDGPIY